MKKKVEKPKRKRKHESAEIAFNAGETLNSPNIKISDFFKSILYSVKDGKTIAEHVLVKQSELAMDGDSKAAEFLFDRAYGRPTQSIQVETPPQVVVQHNVISVEDAKQLPDA